MKMRNLVLFALLGTLASQPAVFAQQPESPNAQTPMAGGNGPGMGRDYRRNVGGPGRNPPAEAIQQPAPAASDVPPGDSRPAAPVAPAPPLSQAPGMPYGVPYPAYPGWSRGTVVLPPRPDWNGYPVPAHRQGYGYPGFRGQGYSPYPRHRQYANPPGIPSAPNAAE